MPVRVGAARQTVKDHGAQIVADFSDFGFPSTYMCDTEVLLDLYQSLLNKVQLKNPDYIIVEIADGILERETKAIIEDKNFRNQIDGVIFSAVDSLSALMGANHIKNLGYRVLGISGLVTTSPLLVKEIKANTDTNVYLREDLMTGDIITVIDKTKEQNTNEEVGKYNRICI